jgi:transposase
MDRLKLNGWQRRRLRRQLRSTREVRLYRRTLTILELDRGRSARDVALSLGVQPRTVYYWAEAYLQDHDPSSLCDAPRSGRPSLWTERLERRLSEAMDQSPQEHGYPSVDWTVPLLLEHLGRHRDGPLSDDTIRRRLRRLGFVWKRSRYVLNPDPELEKKTANPPPAPPSAAAQRRHRRGRDRPAAVPATTGRLGTQG